MGSQEENDRITGFSEKRMVGVRKLESKLQGSPTEPSVAFTPHPKEGLGDFLRFRKESID